MLAEALLALVGDVDTLPSVGDVVGRSRRGVGVGREGVGDQRIGRHDELHALLLGQLEDLEGHGEHVGLADRVADLAALCGCEGVGHAAADDDRVNLLDEGLDDTDLRRYLRSAHDGAERVLRGLHQRGDGLHLFLHQVAEHLVVGELLGNQVGRGVLAVCRAECVVDVAVGIRGELLDELLLRTLLQGLLGGVLFLLGGVLGQAAGLALLLGVETQVLKQHDLARLDVLAELGSLLAHAVAGELYLHAEVLLDGRYDLLKRVFHIGILLRTSHVRHENHGAALGEHLLDRRHGGTDTGVVRHLALLVDGHVEIHADNRALALEIVVVDRNHSFWTLILMF